MLTIFLMFSSLVILIFSVFNFSKGYVYYASLIIISIYSFFISLASLGVLEYDFAKIWSQGGVVTYSNQVSIYTFLIMFFYYFSIVFVEKIEGKTKVKLSSFFETIKTKSGGIFLKITGSIIFLVTLFQLFNLDWDVLWLNDSYLAIGSVDALKNKNIFSITIQMLFPLIGFFSIILLSVAYCMRDYKVIIIIIIPALFFVFLKIGDHSRFSAVYLGVVALILLFSKYRGDRFVLSPVFFILSILAVINSLVGRSGDLHGFAAVGDFFNNFFLSTKYSDFINVIGNIFEGVYVHGEAFHYLSYEYPESFKYLSLSPFPSFIDGYSDNAHHYSLRLHSYVPMGATGEILIFGFNYVLYYFLIIFLSIKMNMMVLKKGKYFIFILTLLLICLASYLQFTYPARNVFRFFYLAIFLCFIFDFIPRLRWGK